MKHIHPTPAAPRAPRRRTSLCLTACLVLATLLAFTACQQDIPADNLTRPDGRYPVLISAAVPQTRVVDEGQTTTWEDGDSISVMLYGHPEEVGIYELNRDGTVKRIIDTLYYNPKETPATLHAWYPATETSDMFVVDYTVDNPVSLMNAWKEVQDYFHPVTLKFSPMNSKLSVQIEGDIEGAVYKVEVDAISQSTFNPSDGVVSMLDSDTKRMRLHPKGNNVWEGYVGNGSQISCVYVNGEAVQLDSRIRTATGQVHNITVNVSYIDKEYNVDLGTLTETYHITEKGIYHFIGTNNMGDYIPIVVEAPATLLLDNVTLDTRAEHAIYITAKGTTTVKVEGTNTINRWWTNDNGNGAITLDGADTHLLLEGSGELSAYSHTHAGIGTPYKPGEQAACGDITIKNVSLRFGAAQGVYFDSGAYIGTGKCEAKGRQTHGNITIANSTIISFSRSKDEAYRIGSTIKDELRSENNGAITIYLKEGETEEDFLGNIADNGHQVDPRATFHPYEETPDWLK